MANGNTVHRHELEELAARLDWLDEERRKSARVIASLEQKVIQQEQTIAGRERRIRELEERLSERTSQMNRAAQVETRLDQFKDELITIIEQYDTRNGRAIEESERLRRVEQEVTAREIAEVRRELPEIGRLRNDMQLRQAEESRLANLIGKLQSKLTPIENRIENWERDLSFLATNERQWAKNITDIESSVMEINRRLEPISNRLDVVNGNLLKAESDITDLTGLQSEVRQMMKGWVDQIQLGEYERNQRLQNWQELLQQFQRRLEQFSQEWIGFSDQNKEAQMAVQTLTDWQRQFEVQQKETSEMARVETNRMQNRWDSFLAEIEKRWRNFEVDQEQRTADALRRDKELESQLYEIQTAFKQLESEKDTLWRVQTAQLDAIKQIPRIWLEEIEKARSRDPNRRREPSLVPIDEELY